MQTKIFNSNSELSLHAAETGKEIIQKAANAKGEVNMVLATGNSQMEILQHLTSYPEIDWSMVNMFHLDEYIGISENHPASFRKYLQERFVNKVGKLKSVHFIQGDHQDPQKECQRLNEIIANRTIDIAFVGVGENGHLAFNDPPADFDTDEPFIIVELDEVCRRQQFKEGWFASMQEVPATAISMSINQIMKAKNIICSVPEKRKAQAVRACFAGPISNQHPASILQNHTSCQVFLDQESSSLLTIE